MTFVLVAGEICFIYVEIFFNIRWRKKIGSK